MLSTANEHSLPEFDKLLFIWIYHVSGMGVSSLLFDIPASDRKNLEVSKILYFTVNIFYN